MSDLTKSMLRFSWAMSLFGVRQMANVLSPDRASRAFDEVSRAAAAELGGALGGTFRAGDAFQSGMVDLATGRAFAGTGRAAAGGAGALPGPGTSAASPRQPPEALPPIGERDISAAYPFEPHYLEVHGSRMHYVEQGTGEPIVLVHGNPSWSYQWRNLIPYLSPLGRCVAPDLIGFGRSDKPKIDYGWFDHARYLDAFMDLMNFRDVTLVLHDQGSALGLHWASRHPERVKAIAFFEALVRPFTWENFSTPQFRELFRIFREGGVGSQGWQMIVEQNMFIEQLLPQATGRPLSEEEMRFYREPFPTPDTRVPIWKFPRQTAIGGEPRDVWDAVSAYSEWLQRVRIPKLLLYATPGALLTEEHVRWCQQNIQGLESVFIGPGLHFLEESSPRRIGREIAAWIRRWRSGPAGAEEGGAAGGTGGDGGLPARGEAGDGDTPPAIAELRADTTRMLDSLAAGTPIAGTVLLPVDPAKEGRFSENARVLTEETRKLPGCNVFAFQKSTRERSGAEPIEYLIYEDWQTQEQFRVQWDSAHLRRFQNSVGDLLLGPPELRFYFGWYEYRRGG